MHIKKKTLFDEKYLVLTPWERECIKVTIDINSNQKGTGYLKLNTSILKGNQLVDGIKQLIWNFDTSNNAFADWDTLIKAKLKNS